MILKDKLRAGQPLVFEACILSHPSVAQAIAAAGADMVMFDLEHGPTSYDNLHAMIAATAGTDCAPLVRVRDHAASGVKTALDMGAEGIVFPLVRDAQEAAACVATTRYPPRGVRGWGAFMAHSRWGVAAMDYLPTFGDRIVVGLLIETAEAVENIDAILGVEGIDFCFVAPFDLSTSLGAPGQFGAGRFTDAVARIETACAAAGMPLGGGPTRTAEELSALLSRGYRIIGNFDVFRLKGGIEATVAQVRAGA